MLQQCCIKLLRSLGVAINVTKSNPQMTPLATIAAVLASSYSFIEQQQTKIADFAAIDGPLLSKAASDKVNPDYNVLAALVATMPAYFTYVLALNIVLFYAWQILPTDFILEHASFGRDNFLQGRLHIIFTNNVSHMNLSYIRNKLLSFILVMLGLKDEFSERVLWAATLIACLTSTLIPFFLAIIKTWLLHRISARQRVMI